MTLTKKALTRSLNSMRLLATAEQRTAILERFGSEPTPYEWSEQDIFVQLQNFLGCGKFVK